MKRSRIFSLSILCALVFGSCVPPPPQRGFSWEKAIVNIRIDRKKYDYHQPWTTSMETLNKSGVVVEGSRILTTSFGLGGRTVLRVQKEGRGPWWEAEVIWMEKQADLAFLRVQDPKFWQGTQAANIPRKIPRQGAVHIRRWKDAALEDWNAEITKPVASSDGWQTVAQVLRMDLTTKMIGGGWSEPITQDRQLLGLCDAKNESSCRGITASMIKPLLQKSEATTQPELGYFDFEWQTLENPASAQYLGVTEENLGVCVTGIPLTRQEHHPLKMDDVILEIANFHIHSDGTYDDPDYGPLSFEYLATRNRWSG
jgi:hypothetical protein